VNEMSLGKLLLTILLVVMALPIIGAVAATFWFMWPVTIPLAAFYLIYRSIK